MKRIVTVGQKLWTAENRLSVYWTIKRNHVHSTEPRLDIWQLFIW